MKLIDLNPWWAGGTEPTERNGMGVTFDCPAHGEEHRAGIRFSNPLDGGEKYPEGPWWERTGDTFETLSAKPSIRVSYLLQCWHGYLIDGEMIPT